MFKIDFEIDFEKEKEKHKETSSLEESIHKVLTNAKFTYERKGSEYFCTVDRGLANNIVLSNRIRELMYHSGMFDDVVKKCVFTYINDETGEIDGIADAMPRMLAAQRKAKEQRMLRYGR